MLKNGFDGLFGDVDEWIFDTETAVKDFLQGSSWDCIQEYKSILGVFNRISIMAQNDSESTISQVIQWVAEIEDVCWGAQLRLCHCSKCPL